MPYPSYQDQYLSLPLEQKKTLEKLPYINEIDGWILLIEAVELYTLSFFSTTAHPIVCEIGVWKGKSSYIFASALKSRGGILYSIDPFTGDGDSASTEDYQREMKAMDMPLLENFEMTMKKYGLWDCVHVLPTLSEKARMEFREENIDLLFIDGNHDYPSVRKDYDLWSPLIRSGGSIVLHDVGAVHVDGPRRVMDESIRNSTQWSNVRIIGEMCVATKI